MYTYMRIGRIDDRALTETELHLSLSFLSQFIRRQQVLSLYRDLLRAARDLESARERKDARDWIRKEFETWRHTKDEVSARVMCTERSAIVVGY